MQVFHEILQQLKALPDSPSLLIIDNADENLSLLKEMLPGQPAWHVLITSRQRLEGFYTKELDFLSPKEAINLFKKHCHLIKNEDQIAELVKAVDYHTLTIEILAKTAQLQRFEIKTLKTSIKEDLKSNVYVEHKGEKIDSIRSYLSSIFNLSGLNKEEVWLMKQFTCLPAEFHTYKLLLELIDPHENQNEVFSETLNRLVELGWLFYNTETDAYKMHLIVKEVAARQLASIRPDVDRLLNNIFKRLAVDQNKDNPVDKFIWIPFGNALLENFQDDISPKISGLQNNQAMVLQDLGDYTGARALLEKTVRSYEKAFGPDHPSTIVSYSNLALVLQDLGDFTEARTLLEKTVRWYEKNFGLDHPSTIVSYSNLAVVLKYLGDYTEARTLLEKALSSDEKNFGPDHPRNAVRQSNLALVLQDLGDCIEARTLLEKALSSDEKNFGPDHPTTIVSYSNLAIVLRGLGDYTGAKELLEKTLHSNEKNFGPDHPSTAKTYSNLGVVLQNLGDLTQAKALLEKAVRSDEKNFGLEHYTTAISYSNLALVLIDLGDFSQALELSNNSLTILRKTLPQDHPSIKTAQKINNSIKAL